MTIPRFSRGISVPLASTSLKAVGRTDRRFPHLESSLGGLERVPLGDLPLVSATRVSAVRRSRCSGRFSEFPSHLGKSLALWTRVQGLCPFGWGSCVWCPEGRIAEQCLCPQTKRHWRSLLLIVARRPTCDGNEIGSQIPSVKTTDGADHRCRGVESRSLRAMAALEMNVRASVLLFKRDIDRFSNFAPQERRASRLPHQIMNNPEASKTTLSDACKANGFPNVVNDMNS